MSGIFKAQSSISYLAICVRHWSSWKLLQQRTFEVLRQGDDLMNAFSLLLRCDVSADAIRLQCESKCMYAARVSAHMGIKMRSSRKTNLCTHFDGSNVCSVHSYILIL